MECSTFKPALMYGFIEMFAARRILDISAGWGDRLAGAIAAEDKIDLYFATDPNAALYPGYAEMIDTLARDKTKFNIVRSPFEDVQLPAVEFDLVFTSPPYFTLEQYFSTTSCDQSIVKNPTLDGWFSKFLIPSLTKAFRALRSGGIMAININDRFIKPGEPHYILAMLTANTEFKPHYKGCISYASDESRAGAQPIWIWMKP